MSGHVWTVLVVVDLTDDQAEAVAGGGAPRLINLRNRTVGPPKCRYCMQAWKAEPGPCTGPSRLTFDDGETMTVEEWP
jgi:hypothetical protein